MRNEMTASKQRETWRYARESRRAEKWLEVST